MEASHERSHERLLARAFTSKKVIALTGLSARQLQYWDEQGFLSPSLRRREGKGRRRLYDFRDLVSLRVAAQLRQTVTLQLIRRAVEHLRQLDYDAPLSTQRWWAVNGELYFEEAQQVRGARHPGQAVVEGTIDLPEIVHDLQSAIVKLDQRPHGKVERRRGALGSKPLIAGTRIPVESVQRLHDDGADEAEILGLYPDLSVADVRAALAEELPSRQKRAS